MPLPLTNVNESALGSNPAQQAMELARRRFIPPPTAPLQAGTAVPLPMPPEIASRPAPLSLGDLPASVIGAPSMPSAMTQPRTSIQPLAPTTMEGHQAELARLTQPPLARGNPLAHTRSDTGLAGNDQIKHAGLRIPLKILSGLGDAFLPALTMNLPGTQLHHDLLVHNAAGNVERDESQENEASKRALEEKQGENLGAEAELHNKKANAVGEKPGDPTKTIETETGIKQFNPQTGKYDIPVGEAPGKNSTQHVVAEDGSVIAIHTNAKTGETTHEVVYHGDPKVETEVAKLSVGGKSHSVIVNKKTGETIKDLGETGEKTPTVNVNAGVARADRSYDKRNAEINTIEKPISDLRQRFSRLQDTIGQSTPQADALIAPELLTVMAGGMGSGLRMNEAEIARIVGGRSKWETLKASANKWRLDPAKANSITPDQRQQIRALVDTVGSRLSQKNQVLNDAYQRLSDTDDEKEHRHIVNEVRRRFAEIDGESGGGAQPTGQSAQNGTERWVRKNGKLVKE